MASTEGFLNAIIAAATSSNAEVSKWANSALEKLSEDESLKRKIDSERRSCIVA